MAAPEEAAAAVLSRKLAPWLAAPLARLEQARAGRRLGHAWLLAGPTGVGKINLALVFARRLLMSGTAEAETLSAEQGLAAYRERHAPADHHPDLHWIFPADDKQSIGVDQIREVSQMLCLKGFSGPAKVVLIEPAEAMTGAAANALLKTLEEPTADTYLLLLSARPGRLPATIRSRCQHLNVAPPAREIVAHWLGTAPTAGAARAPLAQLGASDLSTANEINELKSNIDLISRGELDPQLVADRWLKCDLDRVLGTLTAHVQHAIRARFLEPGSNSVTDPARDVLHNAPGHNAQGGPALKLLFDQLDATERLRDQVGRGTNVELAVRVLLSGFKPV